MCHLLSRQTYEQPISDLNMYAKEIMTGPKRGERTKYFVVATGKVAHLSVQRKSESSLKSAGTQQA